MKKYFLKEIEHEDTNEIPYGLTIYFPQTLKASGFSLSNMQGLPQTLFYSITSFLKRSFEAKKLEMEELEIFAFFFGGYSSKFPFTKLLTSSMLQ